MINRIPRYRQNDVDDVDDVISFNLEVMRKNAERLARKYRREKHPDADQAREFVRKLRAAELAQPLDWGMPF